jgi:hypothetical protein
MSSLIHDRLRRAAEGPDLGQFLLQALEVGLSVEIEREVRQERGDVLEPLAVPVDRLLVPPGLQVPGDELRERDSLAARRDAEAVVDRDDPRGLLGDPGRQHRLLTLADLERPLV